jgi:hypothetical protein
MSIIPGIFIVSIFQKPSEIHDFRGLSARSPPARPPGRPGCKIRGDTIEWIMEITAIRSLRNCRLTNYQLRLVARNGKIRYDEDTN